LGEALMLAKAFAPFWKTSS